MLPAVSNSNTAGAALQQSVRGGVVAAPDSSGLISRGRLKTQMWSSLSVTITGTPRMSHLFGSGLGQVGSTSYIGGFFARTAGTIIRTRKQKKRNAT